MEVSTLDDVIRQMQTEPEVEAVPEDVYDITDEFPPRFNPGTRVTFLFSLPETNQATYKNGIATLTFNAEALTNGDGSPVPPTSTGKQPTVNFNRVTSRSGEYEGRTIPSDLHQLYRSLVGRNAAKETGVEVGSVLTALQALNGRATFVGLTGWRYFDKDTNTEYATNRTKSRSYTKADGTPVKLEPWPRDAATGGFARQVAGHFGKDFITRFVEKKVEPLVSFS